MKKIITEDYLDSFISSYEDASISVEAFIDECRTFPFVKPIVIALAEQYLKTYKELFTKAHMFWLMTLSLKLEDGDICVKIDENSLKGLIFDKICSNLYENDEFSAELVKELEQKIQAFVQRVVTSSKEELLKVKNPIVSDDLNDKAPLFVYAPNTEQERIYFRSFYVYEHCASSFVKEKSHSKTEYCQSEIDYLKNALSILFDDSNAKVNWQKVAAASSYLSDFSVICGGPGTGKTTTVLKLLMLLLAKDPDEHKQILLCAPTGKAATRMVESIEGQLQKGSDFLKTFKLLCDDNHVQESQKLLDMIPKTATTVHKCIKVIPHKEKPVYNESNPLPCDILVVDEVSMISLSLFAKLIKAIGPNTKVILLGDKDQLFSVEPGTVFSDLCSVLNQKNPISKAKLKLLSEITSYSEDSLLQKNGLGYNISENVSMLVESHRFKSTSKLGLLATRVNQITEDNKNEVDSWYKDENLITENKSDKELFDKDAEVCSIFINDKSRVGLRSMSSRISIESQKFLSAKDEFLSYLSELNFIVRNEDEAKIAFERLNHYRILCANRNGPLGTVEINKKVNSDVQTFLKKSKLNFRYDPEDFYPGKVILITKNDSFLNVDNGDVGFVAFSTEDDKAENRLKVFFPPKDGSLKQDKLYGSIRVISPERLGDYESGFAMTIHKSQGSEYSYVCMVLCATYNPVLTKELIYTGLTRAKSKDISVGNEIVTVGGKVSIITDKELFKECVVKQVHRESGLSVMLGDDIES
ncbi:MAG: exodeoxyribonuclease V subunit alpha [Succinivibrio sp.]|jgi:exodeoxyribonuclease V alpha subunit